MSHLQNIATRQRQSLVRDTIFVACLAVASFVSASTVSQAVKASSSAPTAPTTIVAHQ
jgi:hypothetical protein